MKILTINTHSLVEKNYLQKLDQFVAVTAKERPDVIAMQEVNQSMAADLSAWADMDGYVRCKDNEVPVRADNHVMQAAKRLRTHGAAYSWTWLPGKVGYGKYDEGMAILVKEGLSLEETDSFYISHSRDYQNWKTRKILGVKCSGQWFYTVHMGWWDDAQEPFQDQWEQLSARLDERKKEGRIWLLGDFNSPAQVRGQGYDRILEAGWTDTYREAVKKDGGVTVEGVIDGWRELLDPGEPAEGMRIDHIWCSQKAPVQESRVIFNGENGPVISDHFGVMIYVSDEKEGAEKR